MLFGDATADQAVAAAASASQNAFITMVMTIVVAVIGLGNNWLNRRYDKEMAILTLRMSQCEEGRARLETEIVALRVRLNMPRGTDT